MKINIKYFTEKPSKSGTRYYWQPTKKLRDAGWKIKRLSDNKDQAAFEAYEQTKKLGLWLSGEGKIDNTIRADRTISVLLDDFLTSAAFKKLATNTQKLYRKGSKIIKDEIGHATFNQIIAADVTRLKDRYEPKTPGKAQCIISTGQAAMSWAIRSGYTGAPATLDLNPWAKQRVKRPAADVSIWLPDQIDLMIETADKIDPSIGTAILLMEWFGQYPSDIIDMKWNIYKNGTFSFKRKKTGAPISAPVSPRLKERLLVEKFAAPLSTYIVCCHATGKPWNIENLRKKFRQVRATAAKDYPEIKKLKMGTLRHTAVTNMFDANINQMDIAAITGHTMKSVLTILDRYNKRTQRQARRATTQRIIDDGRHSTLI
jgi:hypothetical protein